MKLKNKILLVMIVIITFIYIFAYPISYADTPPTPNFSAYSDAAVLIDSNTGKILFDKNANEKMYPASTTKILTAIIAIEKCNLSDKITASYNAVMSIPSGYSNAAIQPNEELSVQDLLDMFLIHSANEVGMIFAEHISGSIENFADLMNQKASEIGCTNTHFTNPSGIHNENHYSTAYDMALIASYCMRNETFRSIVSKTSCKIEATDKYQERYFTNTNDLIMPNSKYYYEYATGIKTGFTSQAKNCLIAGASKDNLELIAVSLGALATENGSSGRYVDTRNMFEYGFSNYTFQEIGLQNSVATEIVIDNATKDTRNLQLLLKDNLSALTQSNFDTNNFEPLVEVNENLSAPIAEGAVVGKISYTIDDITYSTDLIASHSVEKSDLTILVIQIVSAILVLVILTKLLSSKSKPKKKKSNKKYKSKKNCDSIYKFN